MSLLSVRDLRTYFETGDGIVKAVDGVSFEVKPGEILGIVGESGSGKSVTSLSIMGLIPTPPGRFAGGIIEFEGRDLLSLSEREMQKLRGDRISMIFQDPMTSLNPFLRIERQLTEVLQIHKGLSRSQARIQAVDMLGRVGIPDPEQRIDQYPHEFSGGMRQRVMIAMALLCEPALLLADEPTTALDVTIQAQILTLIRDLVRGSTTSVVLITHDLGVVAGMADRIAVMYAGRIVEHADADALFEAPQHPYTVGLLSSIPTLDGERKKSLVPIPGLPPDLSALGVGCAFEPRCSRATGRCSQQYPETSVVTDGHVVACWERG